MLSRAAVAGALASLLIASPAWGSTGQQIVSYVNAQRSANRIPAGITYSPSSADACAAHNGYEQMNGQLTHQEAPGAPGYTSAGASIALHSVLYQGESWTATSNPFESAPIHLAQVLAPRLATMGANETGPFGCATTLIGLTRKAPSKKVTYSYPANGSTGWRTSELAAEAPYTPGQRRGIPAGTVTGPYLLSLFDAPSLHPGASAKVISANLKDAAGHAVHIKAADNRTSGLAGYMPTGAYIIPLSPLSPGTKYTASLTAKVGKLKFVHQWSFTTA